MRHGLNPLSPNLLIQLRVQPDIARTHRLLCKVNDGFDGPWGSLFEGSAVHAFVKVDGVFAGNDILKSRAGLSTRLQDISSVVVSGITEQKLAPSSWFS